MSKFGDLFGERKIEKHWRYKNLEEAHRLCSSERSAAFEVAEEYRQSLIIIKEHLGPITGNWIASGTIENDIKNEASEEAGKWYRKIVADAKEAFENYKKLNITLRDLRQELEEKIKLKQDIEKLQLSHDILEKHFNGLVNDVKFYKEQLKAKEDKIFEEMSLHRQVSNVARTWADRADFQLTPGEPLPVVVEAVEKILELYVEKFPSHLGKLRSIAYASEEEKRVGQYESIINLYNQKISNIRGQDIDEEDREEAIIAMKRLRDREIELLEQS